MLLKKLELVSAKSGTLSESDKVKKFLKKGLPPLRPILSAVGIPTWKLARRLVSILSDITQNELISILSDTTHIWLVWILMFHLPTFH